MLGVTYTGVASHPGGTRNGHIQYMDWGPWTTPWTWSMEWTTPNFQKEIAPVNMTIYLRSGYEKHRLVFIAYRMSLMGCLVEAGWLGIVPP